MRAVRTLALAGLALLGWAGSLSARVQGQMYCWAADAEFPVPCDEGGEEDEVNPQTIGGFHGSAQPDP
jgi:hypothetical protein